MTSGKKAVFKDTKNKIARMFLDGCPTAAVSERFGVSKSLVRSIWNECCKEHIKVKVEAIENYDAKCKLCGRVVGERANVRINKVLPDGCVVCRQCLHAVWLEIYRYECTFDRE